VTQSARAALEEAISVERLPILASLIRVTGDWALAEDCLQDAAERALAHWPDEGVPSNAAAWLTTAARRRAIDVLRRRSRESKALRELVAVSEREEAVFDAGGGYADDRLRLLFACCHPVLSMQDRVALTLKTVCGLSTRELARLFLVSTPAMSQRLLRTRRTLSQAGVDLAVPPPDEIANRVDGVLAVIYLVFTEGYDATEGPGVRDDLSDLAITLAQLASWLLVDHGEAHALRALLLLQHARRPARLGLDGELIPLEEQDHSRWDRPMIAAGLVALAQARAAEEKTKSGTVGPYRVQAEIAALHSTAINPGQLDWAAVVEWYDLLLEATSSPVVALSRAVAVGMRDGPAAGLVALASLEADPVLADHSRVVAVRADLLRRAGLRTEALAAYGEALADARTDGARLHFQRRVAELERKA
jgi:RNA polymerase sigma-70 factor (ECF subfamily)